MSHPIERFARRCDWPNEQNPLTAELAARRAAGLAVLDLTEANPTRCGLAAGPEFLGALNDPSNAFYEPDPRGLSEAREAVRAYYDARGAAVSSDRIFLTAGTSEAYGYLLRLLTDPGDAVLVPVPSYPLFDCLLSLGDARPSPYRLIRDGRRWAPDLEEIRRAFAEHPAPKAILAVHPNNPTGSFYSAAERREIDALAAAAGAAVISDEVFLDFAAGAEEKSFAGENQALTFVLSGVSKVLALPQMKLGWIAIGGPPLLADAAAGKLEIIADTYLTVNTPAQRALPAWLAAREQPLSRVRARIAENRRTLASALEGARGARLLEAEGGWYGVLEADGGEDDELALRLLREDGVYVHPGYFFDFDGGCHLVVSLLSEPARFGAAALKLAARLRTG